MKAVFARLVLVCWCGDAILLIVAIADIWSNLSDPNIGQITSDYFGGVIAVSILVWIAQFVILGIANPIRLIKKLQTPKSS
jgi:hypothetical protein